MQGLKKIPYPQYSASGLKRIFELFYQSAGLGGLCNYSSGKFHLPHDSPSLTVAQAILKAFGITDAASLRKSPPPNLPPA